MTKMNNPELLERLQKGNEEYVRCGRCEGDVSASIRELTERNGQKPFAVIITCSDSRVIPEAIFNAGIGDLFVIRVAGNVLDDHQLGSIEYAAAHLGSKLIVMLGHTGCGAVGATISGGGDGFIKFITDKIADAIGNEKDAGKACELNVISGVNEIREAFRHHEEIQEAGCDVIGAVYDIKTGRVRWLEFSEILPAIAYTASS